jgi:predicted hotdog family 3-hydroxylacyl-ACP dehydratase
MGRLSDLGLSLADLLPHREPMVLVEEVLEVDRTVARTCSTVRTSWPLAEPDGVQPLVLIELAAQTAGVCNGWDRINTKGPDSEKMGYLVGVKRARLPAEPL